MRFAQYITRRFASRGLSVSEWLIYGLIAVVTVASVYAIFGSVTTQQRVATTFIGWYENKPGYDKALADQKSSDKSMLVYIFASWCPHCKQFAAQILSSPEMRQFVQDYPHVRIEPEHGKAERAIMDEFGAKGYPAFYVVLPDGKRIEIEPQTEGGGKPHLKTPAEFIASIREAMGESPMALKDKHP